MKLTLTILLFCLVGASASTYSQNTRLDISIKDGSMVELIKQIEEKSEFFFYYQKKELAELDKITVEAQNATVMDVLDEALEGSAFDYRIIDRYIVVRNTGDSFGEDFLASAREMAGDQQQGVSGSVTDAAGQALPGVTVVVKGTSQGTVTNADGEYSLPDVPEDATLVFSFVGMRTQEVEVEEQTSINVTMEEDVIGLEEVAVIGYSTKRKSELSSSITVVSEKELMQTTSSTNLSSRLQGRVPGMMISGTSGAPGSGAQMVVQGRGSLEASSAPLTVVDGIIGGSYDPKDIESISILRDAAATGVYGSRAANGVLVITTKSGQAGDFKVSVNSLFGPTSNWDDRVELHDAESLYDTWSGAMKNLYDLRVSEEHPDFVNSSFEEYRNGLIPSSILDRTTNWYDLLTRPGFLNQHNISLSGGNEKTTFYVSGTYNHEKGTYLDYFDESFNFRTNISHKVSDKVDANLRMTYSYDRNNEFTWETDPQWQAYENVPVDPAFQPDGVTPTHVMDYNQTPVWYHWTRNNYMLEREESENWRKSLGGTLMGEVSWQVFDWGRFNTANRVSFSNYDDPEFFSKLTRPGFTPGGYVQWQQGNNFGFITSNTLHLSKEFGEHNFGGILGQEYNFSRGRWVQGRGHGMVGTMTALSSAGKPNAVGGDMSEFAFLSYFAQFDYDFRKKYYLVASYRNDASSVFGENDRWGSFYSVGGNWAINRESFLEDVLWLDALKLRASYGTTGNADIDNYLWMGTYSFTNNSSYNAQPGAWPARLANPNLTWEIAQKTNVGLDIGIFERATIEINVYHKMNDDLLQSVPLQATTGFTNQVRNIGSIQNRGVDFNIVSTNIDSYDFSWQSNFNITFNKNEVVELNDNEDIIDTEANRIIRVGLPLQYWYLREWQEVDPQTGKNVYTRWEDEEGNRLDASDTDDPYKVTTTDVYQDASILATGSAYPVAVGGFSNIFTYKNFNLDVITNFAIGHDIMNSSNFTVHDVGTNELKVTKWQDDEIFWEKPGDNANIAQVIYGDPYMSRGVSTRGLYDGSYLRFQRVSIGYTFPSEILGLKNLNLNASVENLALITNFPFGDSDTSFENPSTGASRYRPTRKFLFNIIFDL